MQRTREEIRFGELSILNSLIPLQKAIFITSTTLRRIAESLAPSFAKEKFRWIEVPDGEACKSFSILESLCRQLLEINAGPDSTLVAIGGGSISDLAGFAAHIWNRGIQLVIVPTTLLSMIDASIGGKNALDLDYAKNVIGSIHVPRFVVCDLRWLQTLSKRDFTSGLAEAIKHAIIDGDDHVQFLERIAVEEAGLEAIDLSLLKELVQRSQAVKQRYVEMDLYDTFARHVLNYGHTFGHAIELLTGLPHGYAVAAGIGAANALAVEKKILDMADAERIRGLLETFGLPSDIPQAFALAHVPFDPEVLLKRICADKKRRGDTIDFVLPHAIGDVRIEPIMMKELDTIMRGKR